jgi:hypothetical protein
MVLVMVGIDCTSQEKAGPGHVAFAVSEVSKTASKGAQNGSYCPGNERCGVKCSILMCGHLDRKAKPILNKISAAIILRRWKEVIMALSVCR